MQPAPGFIASGLRFQGKAATVSTAVSFIVMIIAVCVSSGFRKEIRIGLASVMGDIQLTGEQPDYYSDKAPVSGSPSYLPLIGAVEGVERMAPVIYRAGIVKWGDGIQGVLFKGISTPDSLSSTAVIPRRLADMLAIEEGDRITAYFVSEKVKARRFTVQGIENPMVEADDRLVVTVPISDLRRVNGWEENEVSAIEITLNDRFRTRDMMLLKEGEIGSIACLSAKTEDPVLVASSSIRKYPQVYDWLQLIDTNVLVLILLMTLVAGVNMISSLLILLLRHISTIGTLKAMGMTDRGISSVFLRVSSRCVLKGMAIGNAAALMFCLIQGSTHLIRLNPVNYFVSFVPVSVNLPAILLADMAAWLVIMALLTLPCLFISRVDPAESIRMR